MKLKCLLHYYSWCYCLLLLRVRLHKKQHYLSVQSNDDSDESGMTFSATTGRIALKDTGGQDDTSDNDSDEEPLIKDI